MASTGRFMKMSVNFMSVVSPLQLWQEPDLRRLMAAPRY